MKFDLSDVSFLIPARIDSRERWENLDAVIKYISNNFDTCIYVLEADCDQKIQPDEINAKFSYHFVYDSSAVYHKTRYVNMLLRLANSTYAVVWDADVIAHPDLVLSGICKLRETKIISCYSIRWKGIFGRRIAKFHFQTKFRLKYIE